jgi:hypothetical protein
MRSGLFMSTGSKGSQVVPETNGPAADASVGTNNITIDAQKSKIINGILFNGLT